MFLLRMTEDFKRQQGVRNNNRQVCWKPIGWLYKALSLEKILIEYEAEIFISFFLDYPEVLMQ